MTAFYKSLKAATVAALGVVLYMAPTFSVAQTTDCDLKLDPTLAQKLADITSDFALGIEEDKAVLMLSQLESLRTSNHWIVPYWESIVQSTRSEEDALPLADEALALAASQLGQSPASCAIAAMYGLKARLLQQRARAALRQRDIKEFREYQAQSNLQLDNAVKNNPDSPLLLIMVSSSALSSGQATQQQQLSSWHGLQRAEQLLADIEGKDAYLIEGWNRSSIANMQSFVGRQLNPKENLKNLSEFTVERATDKIQGLPWQELLTDPEGDIGNKNSGDGKAFYYHYDQATQQVWFKLEQHNDINPSFPAVSISFDNDGDSENGAPWYGSNREFKVDGMISVGVVQNRWYDVLGYNGFTDAEGITTRNWLNGATGVIQFYVDPEGRSYYLAVDRKHFGEAGSIRLIGSVGANALWNDDIGNSEVATIKLE